jgi:hypothetical protein
MSMRPALFNRPLGGLLRTVSTVIVSGIGRDNQNWFEWLRWGVAAGYLTTFRWERSLRGLSRSCGSSGPSGWSVPCEKIMPWPVSFA